MLYKNVFLSIGFLWLAFPLNSQVSVGLSHLKLSEDYGRIYGSAFGVEIAYGSDDWEDKFDLYISMGVFLASPKLDVFPTYAIGDGTLVGSNSGAVILDTYSVYSNLLVIPINLAIQYKLLDRSFSPYLSFSISGHGGFYEQISEGGLVEGNTPVEFGSMGVLPSIGLLYIINDRLQIRSGIGKYLTPSFLAGGGDPMRYWQSSLTVSFRY